jgi:hypothetical protein
MAWQAVDAMAFGQAGGGGPQGTSARAGSARGGFDVLTTLAFGIGVPPPSGTRRELAAVRHALSVWGVTTVVIAPLPTAPFTLEGHDPTYAAAFMTAALGRMPHINAGAWVWDDVAGPRSLTSAAVVTSPSRLGDCVAQDERVVSSSHASLRVADCVLNGTSA